MVLTTVSITCLIFYMMAAFVKGFWKKFFVVFEKTESGLNFSFINWKFRTVSVLVGLSCWCCYFCPLYKKLYEYDDDDDYPTQPQSRQFSTGNR